MTILRRETLARLFPGDPRARSELEALSNLASAINDKAAELQALVDSASAQIAALGGDWQPAADVLASIADLGNQAGAVELRGADQAVARPIDTADGASLVSRSGLLVSGTTANRPSYGGIYYDTTIGKPIFWNGSAWKDATGASV